MIVCISAGLSKAQEMDSAISCLEADKSKLVGQLAEVKRDLADKESQNASLETRINQRNTQLIELQEQINQKCMEITTIEREVLTTFIWVMVLNATFNNILVISWRSDLLVKETRVPRENPLPITSH